MKICALLVVLLASPPLMASVPATDNARDISIARAKQFTYGEPAGGTLFIHAVVLPDGKGDNPWNAIVTFGDEDDMMHFRVQLNMSVLDDSNKDNDQSIAVDKDERLIITGYETTKDARGAAKARRVRMILEHQTTQENGEVNMAPTLSVKRAYL